MLIYIAVNRTNGKCYVGQTIRSLHKRKIHHACTARKGQRPGAFPAAIRKYGMDGFDWWELDCADTRVALDKLEQDYIKYFDSLSPKGYNLDIGGHSDTGQHTETKKCRRGSHIGYKHTEESKKRMSASRMGLRVSDEAKAKISAFHKGKKHSPERCQKMKDESILSKPIIVENIKTGEIRSFKSNSAAARELSLSIGNLCSVANGNIPYTKNWALYRADKKAHVIEGRKSPAPREIFLENIETGQLFYFSSLSLAAQVLDCAISPIHRLKTGEQKTHRGYKLGSL